MNEHDLAAFDRRQPKRVPVGRRALALACQEIAGTWINGNRKDALGMVMRKGWPCSRCVATAAGVLRVLAKEYGDDHASDFASAITKPFGGHFK